MMRLSGTISKWERQTNILDPIQKNLDQHVFKGIQPRYSVETFIEKLYYKWLKKKFRMDRPEDYAELYINGSLTTYQFSKLSDCDISVFPNYPEFQEKYGLDPKKVRTELISLSIDNIDGTFLPGSSHPLQFFVVADGIRPGDLYKPGLRSAYSLADDMWLVPPEKDRAHDIKKDFPELFTRASAMADKMNEMLDHDPEQAREF